jgi:hypothetical protein
LNKGNKKGGKVMNNTKDQIVVRDNAANQILNLASSLAEQIQDLSIRVDNRLEPISRPNMPSTTVASKEQEELPPYFAKLREHLYVIRNNIHNISSSLDRLEI